MKKSLRDAIDRARAYSKINQQTVFTIMDKKYCHAIISTSEWIQRQRILEGWHTVCYVVCGEVFPF